LPAPLPPHLRAHPVATLAATGQLDAAVVALMGDVPNPPAGPAVAMTPQVGR